MIYCIGIMMRREIYGEIQPEHEGNPEGNIERVDSLYWSGIWGYIFPYCRVDEAIRGRIDPIDNPVVAALGNAYGSNTRRVKFQYYPFY